MNNLKLPKLISEHHLQKNTRNQIKNQKNHKNFQEKQINQYIQQHSHSNKIVSHDNNNDNSKSLRNKQKNTIGIMMMNNHSNVNNSNNFMRKAYSKPKDQFINLNRITGNIINNSNQIGKKFNFNNNNNHLSSHHSKLFKNTQKNLPSIKSIMDVQKMLVNKVDVKRVTFIDIDGSKKYRKQVFVTPKKISVPKPIKIVNLPGLPAIGKRKLKLNQEKIDFSGSYQNQIQYDNQESSIKVIEDTMMLKKSNLKSQQSEEEFNKETQNFFSKEKKQEKKKEQQIFETYTDNFKQSKQIEYQIDLQQNQKKVNLNFYQENSEVKAAQKIQQKQNLNQHLNVSSYYFQQQSNQITEMMKQAKSQQIKGNNDKAIEIYKNCYKIKQRNGQQKSLENAKISLEIGKIFLKLEKFKEGAEFSSKSLKISKQKGYLLESAQSSKLLGYTYLLMKNFEKAIEPYQSCLQIYNTLNGKRNQQSFEILISLSICQNTLNNTEKFKKYLEEAKQVGKNYPSSKRKYIKQILSQIVLKGIVIPSHINELFNIE